MRIAVDAMGGDYAPVETVKGAIDAVREYGVEVVLVGDIEQIRLELAKYPDARSGIELRHASQVVQMDEHPAHAIRRKTDSSIVVAANLVHNKDADAMVSAGNTGAAMAVSTLRLGRIRGIDRPAIASLLPTKTGKAVILDAGANVDCSVDNLLQFAVMGNDYASRMFGLDRPRVGLLSIGEEPTKGDELTKATNARLSKMPLNFIGNVEGKEIFRGDVDVVVCDGFAGNIVLKVSEGIGEFIMSTLKEEIHANAVTMLGGQLIKPAIRRALHRLDYAEYGGAPLLGVNGVSIIGHGRSNAKAIRNAIKAAAAAVENNVVECIESSMDAVS